MRQRFSIYVADDRKTTEHNDAVMESFTCFVNMLSAKHRKFTCTPWKSADGHESGFVVWYFS